MQEVLTRSSPDHRAVLVMKEIDGPKHEDIAYVLRGFRSAPSAVACSALRMERRNTEPSDGVGS